jgi:hypothetical protein
MPMPLFEHCGPPCNGHIPVVYAVNVPLQPTLRGSVKYVLSRYCVFILTRRWIGHRVLADSIQWLSGFLTQASFFGRTPRAINDPNESSPSPQPESSVSSYPSPSPLKAPFTAVPENTEVQSTSNIDGYNGQ